MMRLEKVSFVPQQEVVTIRNESGASAQGAADEVVRYSDAFRLTVGTLYIVGGFLGAGVCLLPFSPHIVITTWALPLLGISMGRRTLKRRTMVYEIIGTCPTCQEEIKVTGGSIDEPGWQKCPECGARLTFELQPSAAKG